MRVKHANLIVVSVFVIVWLLYPKVYVFSDTTPIFDGDKDVIIFIDKRLSEFMKNAYQINTCSEELTELSRKYNYNVIIDDNRFYLSYSSKETERDTE